MKNCVSCGGDLISASNQYWYCTYCGNVYEQDGTNKVRSIDKKETRNFDVGASVFEDNMNSVLQIECVLKEGLAAGSGLMITDGEYAITNTHVVTEESGEIAKMVAVRVGGEATQATVVKLGDKNHGLGDGIDLALIKLNKPNKNAKAVRFADFNEVKMGERVFTVGNSLGHGTCITTGIVSDKRRLVDGKMLLMTDCAINGGNSGGPMFNANGEVIAVIVSGISEAEGMNFAIPADDVISFINSCTITISEN